MEWSDLLVLAVVVLLPTVWLGTLIDALLRPSWQWASVGQSKGSWVGRLVFGGAVAGVVYLASVRRRLVQASRTSAPPAIERPVRTRVPRRTSDWGDPWAE